MNKLNTHLENLKAPIRFRQPSLQKNMFKLSPTNKKKEWINEIFSPTEIPVEPLAFDNDSNKHSNMYFFSNCLETDIRQEEEEQQHIALKRRRNSILHMPDNFNFPFRFEMEKEAENYQISNSGTSSPNKTKKRRKREDSTGFGFSELMREPAPKLTVKMEKKQEGIIIHGKSAKKTFAKRERIAGKEKDTDKFVSDLVGYKRPNTVTTEEHRIGIKIKKVKQYWGKTTLLIPNALLVTTKLKDDDKNLLEFQDYSGKSVLAQSYSQKNKIKKEKVKDEYQEEDTIPNLEKKRSFRLILDFPDDPDVTGLF